jgi:BlaI family transcriptional regulator, penicillinase repressor
MKISGAESLVMEVLWSADRPLAAEEVKAGLADEDWNEATVRTFLTRLVKKKAVSQAKDGRRYLYAPLIRRGDYVHAESKSLVDRLFDGQIGPFFAHFAERENLSDEEIAELKRLVEELSNGR